MPTQEVLDAVTAALSALATLTASLCWPLLVVGLVVLFYKPIKAVLPGLSRLHVGNIDVDFHHKMDRATAKGRQVAVEAGAALEATGVLEPSIENESNEPDHRHSEPSGEAKERLARLAQAHSAPVPYWSFEQSFLTYAVVAVPRDVIIRTWERLEDHIHRMAALLLEYEGSSQHNYDRWSVTVGQALNRLVAARGHSISESVVGLALMLQDIRNDVVTSSFWVSRDTANAYLNAGAQLMFAFYPLNKSLQFGIPYIGRSGSRSGDIGRETPHEESNSGSSG